MIAKLASTFNTCCTKKHFISCTIWAYWRRLLRKNENETKNNHFFPPVPSRHRSSRYLFLSLYTEKPVMVVNWALKPHVTAVSLRSWFFFVFFFTSKPKMLWGKMRQKWPQLGNGRDDSVVKEAAFLWKQEYGRITCLLCDSCALQLDAKMNQELGKNLQGHHARPP